LIIAEASKREIARLSLAELKAKEMIRVPYPPFDVCVAWAEGAVYAIEDACNHAGASLAEGWLEKNCVICPMHAYAFDLKSGALDRPKGLCGDQRTYEVRIEGDIVTIFDTPMLAITGV